MASAFVTGVESVEAGTTDGEQIVTYACSFAGADIGRVDLTLLRVSIMPGDTPTTIRSKLSRAVAAEAASLGYAVAANAMVLPGLTRG
ncbi:MAG: hypothetical protein M3Q71_02790 [Chloroflexota bacterium]|nr:hypothetical protein [Chloroflexota bacterium]